jgi:hypothetical protein
MVDPRDGKDFLFIATKLMNDTLRHLGKKVVLPA